MPSFHDGYLISVASEGRVFECVVCDQNEENHSVLSVSGVLRVSVQNFLQGNIIGDVRVVDTDSVALMEIGEHFSKDLMTDPQDFLDRTKKASGRFLLISSSYGAVVGVTFNGNVNIRVR